MTLIGHQKITSVTFYQLNSAEDSSWNALRQFNKHSLRVLQAQTSLDTPHELNVEISDLKVQQAPEMATLNVQESQIFSQTGTQK